MCFVGYFNVPLTFSLYLPPSVLTSFDLDHPQHPCLHWGGDNEQQAAGQRQPSVSVCGSQVLCRGPGRNFLWRERICSSWYVSSAILKEIFGIHWHTKMTWIQELARPYLVVFQFLLISQLLMYKPSHLLCHPHGLTRASSSWPRVSATPDRG